MTIRANPILPTPRLTASRHGFLARSTALSWPWNKDRILATPGTLPPTFTDLALGLVDITKPVIRVWCKDPLQRETTTRPPSAPFVAPARAGAQGPSSRQSGHDRSPPGAAALDSRLREDDDQGAGHAATISTQHPVQREDDGGTPPVGLAKAGAQGSPPDVGVAALGPRLREDDERGAGHRTAISAQNPVYRERTGPLRNGNPRGNPNLAPRCGARTRRTGCPCRAPAMRNGRCRLHGGKSTGPRTEEGRARIRAARTRHGLYSAEGRAFQRDITGLLRRNRELLSLASQPGPVDTAALRHLLPPEFGKYPAQQPAPGLRPGGEAPPASGSAAPKAADKYPIQREARGIAASAAAISAYPPMPGGPPATREATAAAFPPAVPIHRPLLLARPKPLAT